MNQENKVEVLGEAEQKAVVETYLNDPKVQESMQLHAHNLTRIFRGNWFTLEKIVKKTSFKNINAARDLMTLMTLKSLIVQKQDVEGGPIKYKVVEHPSQRLVALQLELKQIDQRKVILEKEIALVEQQIVDLEKK